MKTLLCASCTSLLLMLLVANTAPVRADGGLDPRAVAAVSPLLSSNVLFYVPGGFHRLEVGSTSSSLLSLFALLDAPASGLPS